MRKPKKEKKQKQMKVATSKTNKDLKSKATFHGTNGEEIILETHLFESAELFAKTKHAHMKRKDGITPYFEHLKDVVSRLMSVGIDDEEILCAGWLHDTIEDTDTDFDDIYERFSRNVAIMVASVTKDKRLVRKEREKQYLKQLKDATWQAQLIKLCDISANLKDLKNSGLSRSKRAKQVKNKLDYLNAIKSGIADNKSKVPRVQSILDAINKILKKHGHIPVIL